QRRDPELLSISCTPFKGHSIDDVETIVRQEVEKLEKGGPEDKELRKVKKQFHASLIYRLESPTWFATWLAEKELLRGDWRDGYRFLNRIDAVTGADVRRVVAKYLGEGNEIKVWLKRKAAPKKEAGK
ncbi:MAG: insulinase family protein, partial [Candidatus Riflebacteria bacterium]|nr:insulinase family protein [Candidatus Riflebacteria bacterium]